MNTRIAVLQGPNLNRLGMRRPERYGRKTLSEIQTEMDELASQLNVGLLHHQSNHEGDLIDWLHAQLPIDGIIINPAGLTPFGRPLLDAVTDAECPTAVVHIAQLYRHYGSNTPDIFKATCDVYIAGLGTDGYSAALRRIVELLVATNSTG